MQDSHKALGGTGSRVAALCVCVGVCSFCQVTGFSLMWWMDFFPPQCAAQSRQRTAEGEYQPAAVTFSSSLNDGFIKKVSSSLTKRRWPEEQLWDIRQRLWRRFMSNRRWTPGTSSSSLNITAIWSPVCLWLSTRSNLAALDIYLVYMRLFGVALERESGQIKTDSLLGALNSGETRGARDRAPPPSGDPQKSIAVLLCFFLCWCQSHGSKMLC